MDETRFDALTKALVAPRTRRRLLGVLGGGALASLGTSTLATKNRNKEDRQFKRRCIPAPKKCKLRKKKDAPGACQKCCYKTYRTVSATQGQCCQPNGYGCRSTAECCLGVCSVGVCQNEVIQLPPPCRGIGEVCTRPEECCAATSVRGDCGFVDPDKGRFGCGLASQAIRCCTTEGWECENTCECCGSMACINGTCSYSFPGEPCIDSGQCAAGTCQVVQPKHDRSCLIPDNQPPPQLCCLGEGQFCGTSCQCCGTLTCQDSECSAFGTG
jgi:hypothetical protein